MTGPSDAVREKAVRYLAEGRVDVEEASETTAHVTVRGSSTYRLTLRGGVWRCQCPARTLTCAHVVAAGLVVQGRLATSPGSLGRPDPELDELLARKVPDRVDDEFAYLV